MAAPAGPRRQRSAQRAFCATRASCFARPTTPSFARRVDRAGRTRIDAGALGRARPPRRPRARLLLRADPQRQGRGPGRPDAAFLAALGARLRHQERELGADGRVAAAVQPRLAVRADGHRFGALQPAARDPQEASRRSRTPRTSPTSWSIRPARRRPRTTGRRRAHALLCGAILHVLYAEADKTLAGVAAFLSDPARTQVETLKRMLDDRAPAVRAAPRGRAGGARDAQQERQRAFGRLSTAMACLGLYRDPVVARNTAASDFRIADLMNADAPVSLYLVVPPSDLARTRPIIRLMLNQIGRRLTESMQVGGKTAYRHRLLLLLDEFPSLGRLEFFETALAFIAGYGLKAFLIAQSLNQLEKAYGPHNSILDNCHVRLTYAANDDRTARRISDLLGQSDREEAAAELLRLGPLSDPPQRKRARVRPAPSDARRGQPAPAGRRHPARRRPLTLPGPQGALLPRPALQGSRRPAASGHGPRSNSASFLRRVAGDWEGLVAAPLPEAPAPSATLDARRRACPRRARGGLPGPVRRRREQCLAELFRERETARQQRTDDAIPASPHRPKRKDLPL